VCESVRKTELRLVVLQAAAAAAEKAAAKESDSASGNGAGASALGSLGSTSSFSSDHHPDASLPSGAGRAPRQTWYSTIHATGHVIATASPLALPLAAPASALGSMGVSPGIPAGAAEVPAGGYAPLRLPFGARTCRSVLRSEVRELTR